MRRRRHEGKRGTKGRAGGAGGVACPSSSIESNIVRTSSLLFSWGWSGFLLRFPPVSDLAASVTSDFPPPVLYLAVQSAHPSQGRRARDLRLTSSATRGTERRLRRTEPWPSAERSRPHRRHPWLRASKVAEAGRCGGGGGRAARPRARPVGAQHGWLPQLSGSGSGSPGSGSSSAPARCSPSRRVDRLDTCPSRFVDRSLRASYFYPGIE